MKQIKKDYSQLLTSGILLIGLVFLLYTEWIFERDLVPQKIVLIKKPLKQSYHHNWKKNKYILYNTLSFDYTLDGSAFYGINQEEFDREVKSGDTLVIYNGQTGFPKRVKSYFHVCAVEKNGKSYSDITKINFLNNWLIFIMVSLLLLSILLSFSKINSKFISPAFKKVVFRVFLFLLILLFVGAFCDTLLEWLD